MARDLGLGTTAEESSGRAGAEQDQVTAAGGMVDAPDAAPWRLDQRAFLARRALRLLAVFLALATRVPPKTARHAGLSKARKLIKQATIGPRLGMNCEHSRKTSGVQRVCASCALALSSDMPSALRPRTAAATAARTRHGGTKKSYAPKFVTIVFPFVKRCRAAPEWHGLSVPTMESIWAALAPRNERLREAKPCAPCSHAGANDRPKTGAKKSRFFSYRRRATAVGSFSAATVWGLAAIFTSYSRARREQRVSAEGGGHCEPSASTMLTGWITSSG